MALRSLKIETKAQAESALLDLGLDPVGMAKMIPTMKHLNIKVPSLSIKEALTIRREMLLLGGEAVVATEGENFTDLLLIGTEEQIFQVSNRLNKGDTRVDKIASDLNVMLSQLNNRSSLIDCNGPVLDLESKTHLMGILNVTPDSFYDGNDFFDSEKALDRAFEMVEEGADIIDVGRESSRPGAQKTPLEEEIKRVIPAIEKIAKQIDIPISIDTYKADVAKLAIDAGAHIVNDISSLKFDSKMADVVAKAACPVILMHMKGSPASMQNNPAYGCVMSDVLNCLEESIVFAEKAGIDPDKIIVDPGIGFGKRLEDNLNIIKNLHELKVLGKSILVGLSRKSFIGNLLNTADVEDRLEGSLSSLIIAVANGAQIVRVHDVKASRKALVIADAILN